MHLLKVTTRAASGVTTGACGECHNREASGEFHNRSFGEGHYRVASSEEHYKRSSWEAGVTKEKYLVNVKIRTSGYGQNREAYGVTTEW